MSATPAAIARAFWAPIPDRALIRENQEQAYADAIADQLDAISDDVAYIDAAWSLPQAMQAEINMEVLAFIRRRPEIWAAYRAELAGIAEAEVIADMDAARQETYEDAGLDAAYWQ